MIYAAFDADGTCLYVGQTTRHPVRRWADHVDNGAPWVWDAVRWEVLADMTERSATDRLLPKYGDHDRALTRPGHNPAHHTEDDGIAVAAQFGQTLEEFNSAPIELD